MEIKTTNSDDETSAKARVTDMNETYEYRDYTLNRYFMGTAELILESVPMSTVPWMHATSVQVYAEEHGAPYYYEFNGTPKLTETSFIENGEMLVNVSIGPVDYEMGDL